MRRTSQPKSAMTTNSVHMLTKSPEFLAFDTAKRQGESFRFMWVWGFLGLLGLLYADSMAHLTGRSTAGYSPVGGIISITPQVVHVFMTMLAIYFAGWMHVAAWSSVYDESAAVIGVALSHALAAAFLTFTPLSLLLQLPFIPRATLADPLPALVPLISTFPVGVFLFYARYSGYWKRKHVTRSPLFIQAPLQIITMLLWWAFVGQCFAEWRRPDQFTSFSGSVETVVRQWATLPPSADAFVNSVVARLPAAYNAVVLHAWVLALATALVAPLKHLSFAPSGRTVWTLLVIGTVSTGAGLYQAERLTPLPAAACAAVLTGLLVRGYEA